MAEQEYLCVVDKMGRLQLPEAVWVALSAAPGTELLIWEDGRGLALSRWGAGKVCRVGADWQVTLPDEFLRRLALCPGCALQGRIARGALRLEKC